MKLPYSTELQYFFCFILQIFFHTGLWGKDNQFSNKPEWLAIFSFHTLFSMFYFHGRNWKKKKKFIVDKKTERTVNRIICSKPYKLILIESGVKSMSSGCFFWCSSDWMMLFHFSLVQMLFFSLTSEANRDTMWHLLI